MNDMTGRTTYRFTITQKMDWGLVVITGECSEYPLDRNAPRYPRVRAEVHAGDNRWACCSIDFGGRLVRDEEQISVSWNGCSTSEFAATRCQQMAMALQHVAFMANRWETEGLHATFDRLYSVASTDGEAEAFTKISSERLKEEQRQREEAERNEKRAALAKVLHEGDKVIALADAVTDRLSSSDAVLRRAAFGDRKWVSAITHGDVAAITAGDGNTPQSLTIWLCNAMFRALRGDNTKKGRDIILALRRLRDRAEAGERVA
jgi:hypothetical protein